MARLTQRSDGGEVVHELLFQSTSIGRGALNDIVIDDPGERRTHAEVLALAGGSYAVRDNRSRGGVAVNGEPVTGQRTLSDGDVVRVGGVELVFDIRDTVERRIEDENEDEDEDEKRRQIATRATSGKGGVVQLTVGTLGARAFGFAREMVATAYFGLSSGLLDAYVAASRVPNLFRDVLGEQAAESAFMPAHRTLVVRGRDAEAGRLLRSVLHLVLIAGLVLVGLGVIFAPWLMRLVAPGFVKPRPDLLAKATWLARWMMPFLVIIAVAAVYGSLLLAERRFWRYSMAPIAASVFMILSVALLSGRLGVGSLAIGVVGGGVLQMLVCAAPYVRGGQWRGLFRRPLVDTSQPALRKVGRSVTPIALAAVLTRLGTLVDGMLATLFCVVGSMAALYEAFRLLQLPFGVFGLAVSRAAFPTMIEHASSQDGEGFSRAVSRALRLNLFLMLPASVALVMLAVPFVRLMYERGRFSPADTSLTAMALVAYAVGLVAMGSRTVLARAFYALLNTRTPCYVAALDVLVNIALSVALVMTSLRHAGLALATSLAAILHAWLLKVTLGREMARQGRRLELAGQWPAVARMAAAALAMALCTWAALEGLEALGVGRGLPGKLLRVAVPGAAGLAAYIGAALLAGCEEVRVLRSLVDRVRRRG